MHLKARFAPLLLPIAVCAVLPGPLAAQPGKQPPTGQSARQSEPEARLEAIIAERGVTFSGESDLLALAESILASDSTSGVAHHAVALVFERRYRQLADLQARRPNPVLRRQVERNQRRASEHFDASIRHAPERLQLYGDLVRFAIGTRNFDALPAQMETMRAHAPTARPKAREALLYSALGALYNDDAESAAAFFAEAMRDMDDAALADYLRLDYILTHEQRQEAARNPPRFWASYWQSRRPRFLAAENERLLAHYERIVLADLLFPGWRDHPNDGWTITPARVLIRYGLPLFRAGWIDDADGMTRQLLMAYPHKTYVFNDWTRNGEYVIGSTAKAGVADGVMAARASFDLLPESFAPPATIRDIGIVFQSARLRPEGSARNFARTDVVVAMGVPITPGDSGDADDRASMASMNDVAAVAAVFALNSSGRVVESSRTPYDGMTPSAYVATPAGQLWCTTTTVPVPAATRALSVEFELPNRRAHGAVRRNIEPRSFDGGSLAVSDLITAWLVTEAPEEGNPCALIRNGYEILPTPTNLLFRADPLYVYFETYNLTPDASGSTRYSVEVVVAPQAEEGGFLRRAWNDLLGRAGDRGVSTRAVYGGSPDDTGNYVILDLADLEPGAYVLGVRIEDLESGEATEVQKEIGVE